MIKHKVISEVVLPKRVAVQPSPPLWKDGDCGACVLSGLIDRDIEWVYRELSGDTKPFTNISMGQAIRKASDLFDREVLNSPKWDVDECQRDYGTPSWMQSHSWAMYIRMAIDAGYYGIAHINMFGDGPLEYTNHIVLICGFRRTLVPVLDGKGGRYDSEILVSCSARNRDGYWIEATKFLREYGGFNCHLARPTEVL